MHNSHGLGRLPFWILQNIPSIYGDFSDITRLLLCELMEAEREAEPIIRGRVGMVFGVQLPRVE